MPLRTSIRIGADEGYELAKATLSLEGFKSYTEVWNDQPLLHTFIITQILKHVSGSVLGPRLVTTFFVLVLLTALFLVSLRLNGHLAATLTVAFLIASPGFLELGSSCMVEIPALAPVVMALGILFCRQAPGKGKQGGEELVVGSSRNMKPKGLGNKIWSVEVLAGVLFGFSLEVKFIGAIYFSLVGLIFWLQHRESATRFRAVLRPGFTFGVGFLASFIAFNLISGEGSFYLQLQQSWGAHFATGKSTEYGSASDHPFDWNLLGKNWDVTIPALVGFMVSAWRWRQAPQTIFPVAWLTLVVMVFATHKPWWACYYIHDAVPLCWCAGIGLAFFFQRALAGRNKALATVVVVYFLAAVPWLGMRLYLEIESARNSPQIYSSLVLAQIAQFKPFTRFLYTDEPVYSFHAGIPMPPRLAIVSLKRLWTGDLTNAKIAAELESVKPGLILIANDTRELPFSDLIAAEYRLIYVDAEHRLYALKSVIAEARQRRKP